MGRLTILFLMLVFVPRFISAYRGHNAVVQKIAGVEQFVPPREGCVAWVTLDASKGCTWCHSMFRQILQALIRSYHPIEHFYSPAALVASHNSKHRDMKGTCFINYLVTDNFKGLANIFNPKALSKIRTKDWIILVEGEKTSHFLKCWADTIDANFGFVFPKVVLIMMHNTHKKADNVIHPITGTNVDLIKPAPTYSAAVACYMCPEGKSYFVGIQNGDRNPYSLVKKAGKWQRTGNLGPPGISPEATYFNAGRTSPAKYMDEDFFWQTVLFAAQQHLNYSFTKTKRGLVFYIVRSSKESPIKQLGSSPAKKVFLATEAESLVYCRAKHTTNKYIMALVSPFDIATWALLIVTVIAISIVTRAGFWLGLNIVWEMIGQPPQGKKIAVLVVIASILFFPLQVLYKEYFASNAMTPYPLEYLDTNQKVINAEFKVICSNVTECVEDAKRMISVGTLKLDLEIPGKFFVRPEEFGNTEDELWLADVRNKGASARIRPYKEHTLLQEEDLVPDTQCDMREEYWYAQTVSFQFTGPLSEAMDDTLSMLREAGIINFWYKVPIALNLRKWKAELAASKADDVDQDSSSDLQISDIVNMNETLTSLLAIFFFLHLLVILCFLYELSGKIISRWKRYRERRRYLRAIWPLGKI